MEVEKIVHEQSKETIKKYLEKNELRKLTKAERIEVANYERETREKLTQAIYIQVQNEQVAFKNMKLNGKENFINTLVNNLHPDLYQSLRGTIEKTIEINKVA